MQYDDFVGQVQARARLANSGQSAAAIRGTLETLGERIPDGLAENIAAQLPREIGEPLRRTVSMVDVGTGERFDMAEFVSRVSARTGMDQPQALYAARAVLEVTDEATQGGIMDRLRESLPDDLTVLSESGSRGRLRE
ncbi:DUF2267 domain-containing protein [Melissospora conviva]|uniref:DUF2267 domain-containing protein n=1 Tax=Melissospora conviva TaxID=3388432 RepID=UPI003B778C41